MTDHTDLLRRLRDMSAYLPDISPDAALLLEAADAIAALREQLAEQKAERDDWARRFKLNDVTPWEWMTRAKKAEAERDALRDAMHRIAQWANAYPLEVFPMPDFERANEVLARAGISMTAMSAANMRHVVEGVGKIARAAMREGKG